MNSQNIYIFFTKYVWHGCPEEAYERKANCEGKSHWNETKVGWEVGGDSTE